MCGIEYNTGGCLIDIKAYFIIIWLLFQLYLLSFSPADFALLLLFSVCMIIVSKFIFRFIKHLFRGENMSDIFNYMIIVSF